jgi:hypothetical protein
MTLPVGRPRMRWLVLVAGMRYFVLFAAPTTNSASESGSIDDIGIILKAKRVVTTACSLQQHQCF